MIQKFSKMLIANNLITKDVNGGIILDQKHSKGFKNLKKLTVSGIQLEEPMDLLKRVMGMK